MRRQAYTLVEIILVIVLMGLLVAFTFPNLAGDLKRRSLVESADRLRSLIVMTHAHAMQDGRSYRIQFPGTPDPNDPRAEQDVDVPSITMQPIVDRQVDPAGNPHLYGEFEAGWKELPVLQEGTRCVAVLPGMPNFEINPHSPIAGPSITEDEKTVFVPLKLNPDGTADWVTFVLTDLPPDIELEERHVGRIINVIVDGRTGQAWMQRAMRIKEVELMNEYGASPILHQDFTNPDEITEDNILEMHYGAGGKVTAGPKRVKAR